MRRTKIAAAALVPVLALTAGCESGYSEDRIYSGTGIVEVYDQNHVIIGGITNGQTEGGVEAKPRIEVQDAYRDYNCIATEVSNDLDNMIAAGTIAVGSAVQFTVNEGMSKEHCIAGSSKSGWLTNRLLLVSLAPAS